MVTPFLPGDSLLFVAGALASLFVAGALLPGALASLETNDLNVHMMVVLMLIAAIVGDAVNYTIGRLFGEKLFSNPNSKIFRRSYLDKTHQFYEKHGVSFMRNMAAKRLFSPVLCRSSERSPRLLREWATCRTVISPLIT